MGRGAIYTENARSDYRSVNILKIILDSNRVICDIKDNDKVPNYDGYLDLINPNGEPLGKLEVQVKTLKKGYKNASYSIKRKLIEYVANSSQLPMLLIAVDQENKKAYWVNLSIQKTKDLLIELNQSHKKSATIHFPKNNEVTLYEPYIAWEDLANDYRRRIDENENPETFKIKLKIDEKAHILIQSKQLFDLIFKEIDFVPLHILIQQFPIRDKFKSRYNNFVLNTYNEKIRQLFESISIDKQSEILITNNHYFNGIENCTEILATILKKLTSNLIYYISVPEEIEYLDIRCFDNAGCGCARCQIEKFSFDKLDFSIEVKDKRIDNLLNQAYSHYKMGHFKMTYHLYKEALNLAIKERRKLSEYIIQYNLSHLASLVESNYYGDDESKTIAKELRKIDLSDTHYLSKNTFHREIQEWMLNDHYMIHFHSKISETKQQLIDHYQNSINGGTGSNNYVNDLINQYAQLNQFLQQNTIINDCYKTYHDIVEMFIEGLFASFSVEGERSSRIDSFNDWLLAHIIKYGRTRSIRRLSNRYKIRNLHYETLNTDHESITEQILRLFNQFESASEKLQSIEEPNYNYFSNEYKKWLNNALYIVSLVDFEKEFIIKFTDSFLSYYKRNTHRLDTLEIVSFLVGKFHFLTDKQRKEMLLMGIREEQLLRSYFLQNLASLCEDEFVTFKLTTKDLNLIVQRPFSQLSNIVSLVHVFRCLSEKRQKDIVQQRILKELEDSFRLDIWNSAILFNVIPLKDEDLAKAIEILTPNNNIAGQPGNPFGGSRYNGGLDQLINVCFNREIDLSENRFDGLRHNSLYYQWLLDIDGFDYKGFDSSWLLEYGTEPYLKRFSESLILKKHLQSLLNNPAVKNKEGLKEAFMDIYVLKGG